MVNLPALESCALVQHRDCEKTNCNKTALNHIAELKAETHDLHELRGALQPPRWKTAAATVGLQLDIDKYELTKLIASTKTVVAGIQSKLNQ